MAERAQAAPSELSALGDVAGALPIPGAELIGMGLSVAGDVMQQLDQDHMDRRFDKEVRLEDQQATAQLTAEEEAAQAKKNKLKNQGTVFGSAKGGKLSPKQIYLNNKLNVGGQPPVKPEGQVDKPMEFTTGFNTKELSVKNDSKSMLDTVMARAPEIIETTEGAMSDSKKMGGEQGEEGSMLSGMFKNKNTTENQQKLNAGQVVQPTVQPVQPTQTPVQAPVQAPAQPVQQQGVPVTNTAAAQVSVVPAISSDVTQQTNQDVLNEVAPKATGGHIQGEGDGSGVDDAIATTLQDEGGYVIPKSEVSKMKQDGVDKMVGHSQGKTANVNKTSDANANTMVSSGEYYFTEQEANDLTSKGVNLDKYAPNADHKMNAATGGWLDGLGNLLGRRTSEGFRKKNYDEHVRDYRGEVPEGTVYDPTDAESIPTIKDWYQMESDYYNPPSGEGANFNRRDFKDAGLDLAAIAEEYNTWMGENRPDAQAAYDENKKKEEGDQNNANQKKQPSSGGISSTNPLVNDLMDWNKKSESLYNKLSGAKALAETAKFAHNMEQTFKGQEAPKITTGDRPMPSLTGQKNMLNQYMGKGTTQRTTEKSSDSAINMINYNASKTAELDAVRTGVNQLIDNIDKAKIARHEEELAVKTKNADLEGKQNQINQYLSDQFNREKGQAMSDNVDAALDAGKENLDAKTALKASEIGLRTALETQEMFAAGQVYNSLMLEFGQDFPPEWIGQGGMTSFMDTYNTQETQDRIAEIRATLQERKKGPPAPPVPPAESNDD